MEKDEEARVADEEEQQREETEGVDEAGEGGEEEEDLEGAEEMPSAAIIPAREAPIANPIANPMSTGMKVGLAVGGVAVVGGLAFLLYRMASAKAAAQGPALTTPGPYTQLASGAVLQANAPYLFSMNPVPGVTLQSVIATLQKSGLTVVNGQAWDSTQIPQGWPANDTGARWRLVISSAQPAQVTGQTGIAYFATGGRTS